MNNISVRQAHRKDFEIISILIADQNKHPETHCIHSDTSQDPQGIQRELLCLDSSSEICFAAAFQADQLVGALGSELDQELGRGWARGPFVAASQLLPPKGGSLEMRLKVA